MLPCFPKSPSIVSDCLLNAHWYPKHTDRNRGSKRPRKNKISLKSSGHVDIMKSVETAGAMSSPTPNAKHMISSSNEVLFP